MRLRGGLWHWFCGVRQLNCRVLLPKKVVRHRVFTWKGAWVTSARNSAQSPGPRNMSDSEVGSKCNRLLSIPRVELGQVVTGISSYGQKML